MIIEERGDRTGSGRAQQKLADKEIEMMRFIHEFGFCGIQHLVHRFKIKPSTAYAYTKTLKRLGLVNRINVLRGMAAVYSLMPKTIQLLSLDLPPLRRISLSVYHHHLAIIDVSLKLRAIHAEAIWLGERRMMYEKKIRQDHLPDGALIFNDGTQCAIEIERTQKSKERWEEILLGYGLQRTFKEVWYFCAKEVKHPMRKLAHNMPYVKIYALEDYLL